MTVIAFLIPISQWSTEQSALKEIKVKSRVCSKKNSKDFVRCFQSQEMKSTESLSD